MAAVEGRDIFNAVYINVRASYISSLYSSKTRTKELSGSVNVDENLKMTKVLEPVSETNVNLKETISSNSETVKETVERMSETQVADKIRVDIEEKFPFALASVCSNLAFLDREYRKLKGYEEQQPFSEYIIETTDEFPLSDRFVFPAIMFISSMVLIDIDEKRSDDFYDQYASAVSLICKEIPCVNASTVEKYPY